MSKLLLLADSNFRKNSEKYLGPKIRDLNFVNCQSKQVLLSQLSGNLEGIVVIACLDVVASEAARKAISSQDRAVELAFNHVLLRAIDCLEISEGKLTVGFFAPIFWRQHSKLTVDGLHHAYQLALKNPTQGIILSKYNTGLGFGGDGVHLVPRAGRKYVEAIYEFFKLIDEQQNYGLVAFESPDLTLIPGDDEGEDMELGTEAVIPSEDLSPARTLSGISASMIRNTSSRVPPSATRAGPNFLTGGNTAVLASSGSRSVSFSVPPPNFRPPTTFPVPAQLQPQPQPPVSWPTMLTPELSTSLAKIEQRIGFLESKALQDNMMMAALQEEQDAEANRTMSDRIAILGIRVPGIRRMKDGDRVRILRQKIDELLSKLIDGDQLPEVLFVRHLNRQSRNPENTVIEIKLKNGGVAGDIRANFVKKRDSAEMEEFSIFPSVRLATRVRIEIMQSIAGLLKQKDATITRTQCLQFVPKPVLKIFRNDSRGNEFFRVMTFIDSVIWVLENELEKQLDLKKAYSRAGSNFKGTISQHFIIMS
jgi:hypothetical protein